MMMIHYLAIRDIYFKFDLGNRNQKNCVNVRYSPKDYITYMFSL